MAEVKKHQILVTVVTPYHNFYEGRADSISLPTQDGSVGIMSGHMPLVLALFPGTCSITVNGEKRFCIITEGYAEISQHMALIVCNSSEWYEDIDVNRAFNAIVENEEILKNPEIHDFRVMACKDNINRAKARLHLVELHGTEEQQRTLKALRNTED